MNINKQKITCTLVRVSFGTPLLLFLETPLTIHILHTLVTTNVRMCNSSGAGTGLTFILPPHPKWITIGLNEPNVSGQTKHTIIINLSVYKHCSYTNTCM